MPKPSDRIRLIMVERKSQKVKGEIDEYDVAFGHESTSTKAIIQYLDEEAAKAPIKKK